MQSREITLAELARHAASYADGVEARRALRLYREIEAAGGHPVIETTGPHAFTVFDTINYDHLVKIMKLATN